MFRVMSTLLIVYFFGYILARGNGFLYIDEYGFFRGYDNRTMYIIAPYFDRTDNLSDTACFSYILWIFYLPIHYLETNVLIFVHGKSF